MALPPDTADPMAAFQQFKQKLAARFNIPLPSNNQVSGPAMSGSTQADRFQQEAGRGTAPFTGGNLLAAVGNAANLMGGAGAVMTGGLSMGEQAAGVAPGSWGGIQNMQHFRAVPPETRRLVHNLVDLEHANSAAQAGGGALDSHGQVRGGGTGSAGGGITQGGPR